MTVMTIVCFTKKDLRACGHSSEAGKIAVSSVMKRATRFTSVPTRSEVFFRETDYSERLSALAALALATTLLYCNV
jgi:hypothetical protein